MSVLNEVKPSGRIDVVKPIDGLEHLYGIATTTPIFQTLDRKSREFILIA